MTLEVGDDVRAVEGTGGALGVVGSVEEVDALASGFTVLVRCSEAVYPDQIGQLLAFCENELEKI